MKRIVAADTYYMKSSNINKMPKLMTIFKRNLEFLSPQEQLYEINSLKHSLNNINFNLTFYAVNKNIAHYQN